MPCFECLTDFGTVIQPITCSCLLLNVTVVTPVNLLGLFFVPDGDIVWEGAYKYRQQWTMGLLSHGQNKTLLSDCATLFPSRQESNHRAAAPLTCTQNLPSSNI
jgi:hypothetical protein